MESTPPVETVNSATAAEPAAQNSREKLDRSLVGGVAWTGGVKWGTQLITWLSTMVVARLLSPSDYGVVGLATLYLGFISLLGEFGIGAAVVTFRDLTRDQLAQMNALAVVVGFLSFAISAAAAKPLALFFHSEQLTAVVVVLSAGFLVSGFQVVPNGILQKELRFRALAGIEGVRTLVAAALAVALAIGGLRYWTLVLSGLFATVLGSAITYFFAPIAFSIPRRASVASAMRLSFHILLSRISWYVYSNADFFVAGRWLGQTALGSYTLAWSVASVPVEKWTTIVSRVTPGLFSAVQHDKAELRRYLLLITEVIAVVTVPAAAGIALISSDFVPLVFGEKWRAAAFPLAMLAIASALRSLTPPIPVLFNTIGFSRFNMWQTVLTSAVMPFAFLAGAKWGISGIALVWVFVYPFSSVPVYWKLRKVIDLRMSTYFKAIEPATVGTVAMIMAIVLVDYLGLRLEPAGVRVATKILVGAAVYAGSILLLYRDRLAAFRKAVSLIRGSTSK